MKNILFDMGNVLISFDPEYFISAEGLEGTDKTILQRELFRSMEWVSLDRGTLSEEEVIRNVCSRVPEHLHESVHRLVTKWDILSDEISGMPEIVRELADNGYSLYLLTNAGPRHREYWPKFPMSAYFPEDHIFRSADHHLLKPDAAFFEAALRQFALCRDECIFIDDSPANAESAQHTGIRSVVFHHDSSDLRRKLSAAGIKISCE